MNKRGPRPSYFHARPNLLPLFLPPLPPLPSLPSLPSLSKPACRAVIALLAPLFQGPLSPMGEVLQCAAEPPGDALAVSALVGSPETGTALVSLDSLEGALRLHARHLGVTSHDLRPVASAWSLQYLGALLPPLAAAASVLQHAFPAAADEMWVRFDARGIPRAFHIRELGRSLPGSDTAARYSALLWRHLAPLFAALARLSGVAPKILWGNAARTLEPILAQALALTGGSPTLALDTRQLLRNPNWPPDAQGLARVNALPGVQREVVRRTAAGAHHTVRLHRQCCLNYLLPGESYCGLCPLAPEHRKAAR